MSTAKNRSIKARTVCIASAAYPVSFINSWQGYQQKIRQWVADACDQDANLLLFPEYGPMELTSLFGEKVYSSLSEQLVAMQTVLAEFKAFYSQLAQQYKVWLVSGTYPVQTGSSADGKPVYQNRAFVFYPDGRIEWQDKLQMTRFENEQWHIDAGQELKVFEADFGRFGINICYDSEFPHFARQQVTAGADLILVPSCTDTLAGFNRVRIGSRARALENQCFVVQSATVGDCSWSPAIDENNGTAAFYSPVDYGFPCDGIVNELPLNQPGWCVQTLDLAELAKVRQHGQVFNYRDWPTQMRISMAAVVR